MMYGDPWYGNAPLPLTGGPAEAPKKSFWDMLAQTWPSRMAQSAYDAVKLPGDVYSGVTPMSPPGLRREDFTDIPGWQQPNDPIIGRATDLAGLIASGTFTGPPPGAIGSSASWYRRSNHPPETEFSGTQLGDIYKAIYNSERSPKNQIRDAIKASGVGEASRDDVAKIVSDIAATRQARKDMNYAYGRDPLEDANLRFGSPFSRKYELEKYQNKKAVNEYAAVDKEQMWDKSFRDRFAGTNVDIAEAPRLSTAATLDALPRALRDLGWQERHVSVGKNKSTSSVYMIAPDKSYQVRISDHWLPDTSQRAYKYESRGFGENWNNDVVINPRLGPKSHLDDIISEYNRWLSETK